MHVQICERNKKESDILFQLIKETIFTYLSYFSRSYEFKLLLAFDKEQCPLKHVVTGPVYGEFLLFSWIKNNNCNNIEYNLYVLSTNMHDYLRFTRVFQ